MVKGEGNRVWKVWLGIAIAGSLVLFRSQPNLGAEPTLKITVHVFAYARINPGTLPRAEEEAARILREAGVDTEWLACSPDSTGRVDLPACPHTLGPTELALRIHALDKSAQAGFPKDWLGYAVPPAEAGGRGSQASVFLDRVMRVAEGGNASVPQLLGHAMAHEIGHLLLGQDAHSPTGIMRSKWRREEFQDAAQGHLLFTPKQSEDMRKAMTLRLQRAELARGLQ